MKDFIINKLRFLIEEANTKVEYGCVLLGLDIPEKKWDKLLNTIDSKDLFVGDGSFGKEKDPHITILYGIHNDVDDAEVEKLIDNVKVGKIKINEPSLFKNEEFDVIKIGVEAEWLDKQNKIFKTLDHTNRFKDYNPHITIAYVKPGIGEKYLDKLSDMINFTPEVKTIIYSKADRSKKVYHVGRN